MDWNCCLILKKVCRIGFEKIELICYFEVEFAGENWVRRSFSNPINAFVVFIYKHRLYVWLAKWRLVDRRLVGDTDHIESSKYLRIWLDRICLYSVRDISRQSPQLNEKINKITSQQTLESAVCDFPDAKNVLSFIFHLQIIESHEIQEFSFVAIKTWDSRIRCEKNDRVFEQWVWY